VLLQRLGLAFAVLVAGIHNLLAGPSAATRSLLPSTASQAQGILARLPLRFEENQGQWNAEVRYAARTGASSRKSNLFFTNSGAVLAGSRRVEISFAGSNPAPAIEALDRMPVRTNYFIGRDQWHTGIPQYARIAYRSVYPGIDIVYYGNGDELEYDFLLRPGADVSAIRLAFRGADRVTLNGQGDLIVEAGDSRFLEKRPVVYQEDPRTGERRAVQGRYRLLAGGSAAFDVSGQDRSLPLVIDPVVIYATFLGGSATDQINAVTTDANGLIYVVGYTDSIDLQPTYNGVQGGIDGGNDAYIAVIDPTVYGGPSLRYLTYLGGSSNDAATGIAVDASGNLYVTGTTSSMDFPLAGNSVQTALALSTTETAFNPNVFVSVISQTNGLVYSTYFGGTGGDFPYGIGLDANGNIYVGGTTQSTDLPVTPNAYAAVLWGPSDVFVLELNINDTSPLYASYIGGEDRDDARGFAVTPDGKVYFAASTLSTLFPIKGFAYQGSPSGIENLVVGQMDLTQSGNPSLVYTSYLGGSTIDELRGMALDANGKLLLTGFTLSSDFPTTSTAFRPTFGGVSNAFATRVNPAAPPNAFIEYSTFVGGTGGDVGYGISSDAAGNLYVAGYTMSADFPVTPDAGLAQYGGGIEAFLVKFNPAAAGPGALEYGSYFGTGGFHVATGVAVAPNGSMFIGGYTTDALFGVGNGLNSAYQTGYFGGYSDGFVIAVR
jgi:hypothetical protein